MVVCGCFFFFGIGIGIVGIGICRYLVMDESAIWGKIALIHA